MRLDVHSHILPAMDDGARDTDTSVKMLEALAADKVDAVFLSSHYYPHREPISSFVARRDEAYRKLCEATAGRTDLPRTVLGAEVYFHTSLLEKDLSPLCFGKSDLLMLELPFVRMTKGTLSLLRDFLAWCPQRIMIAHLERYFSYNKPEDIMSLVQENELLCHVSCSSFFDSGHFEKKRLMRYAREGAFPLMGTDAHNLTDRKPEFGRAEKFLREQLGDDYVEEMFDLSDAIFDDV